LAFNAAKDLFTVRRRFQSSTGSLCDGEGE